MKAEFLFWLPRHRALFAFCFWMVTALSAEAGKEPSSSPAIPVKRHLRFDDTSEVLATVSAAYVRGRIDALNKQEGLYTKTHACFRRLLDAGYDPTLLDECLNALADDAIVVGMPSELVVSYFGNPRAREVISFNNQPAELWSINVKPSRTEKIAVAGGKVVRVF